MRVSTRAAYAAGVLAVVTGCGGGGDSFTDKSFKEITRATSADMQDVKSLHMSGNLTQESQELGLDVSVTTDGECQGEISLGNGSAQIVSTGDAAWMRPDHAFWEEQAPDQSAQIEQTVGDKWVVVPSGSDFDSFCDLDSLLDSFDDDTDSSDEPSKVEGVESVGGHDAVKLSGKSDGQDMSAWVAVDDPHHMLKLVLGGGGDTAGTISFSAFDEPVDVKTPGPSEVIDLSSLGG